MHFLPLSSVVVELFITINLSIRLLHHLLQQVLPFRFVISLNPIFLVYRIAHVGFVSMFPYLAALFSRASPSINRL